MAHPDNAPQVAGFFLVLIPTALVIAVGYFLGCW